MSLPETLKRKYSIREFIGFLKTPLPYIILLLILIGLMIPGYLMTPETFCSREYKFCSNLEKEECMYYEARENPIPGFSVYGETNKYTQRHPGPGHCKWDNESNTCGNYNAGCD